jgi:hypothetical protein
MNRHACSSPSKLKLAAAKLHLAVFTSCFSMMMIGCCYRRQPDGAAERALFHREESFHKGPRRMEHRLQRRSQGLDRRRSVVVEYQRSRKTDPLTLV